MSMAVTQNLRNVAIIGSGPSGFYAAEALLSANRGITIDMFEHLPAPYGLVRYGVAPDHLKLKEVISVYRKIAGMSGFRFFGNVSLGRDVGIGDLLETYDAVVLANGAQSDRKLQIPGESLAGVHSARNFVAWYNGHPDFCDLEFDLSHEVIAVVGQGNVAIDVARVLAKSPDELRCTDIASNALDKLASSKIREIHVIGRRGPAQAKFVEKEIRELGELANCDVIIDKNDLVLNEASRLELESKKNSVASRSFNVLSTLSQRPLIGKRRRLFLHFLLSPLDIVGTERIDGIRFSHNELQGAAFEQTIADSGKRSYLKCGLLFKSIGYQSVSILGVPFDSTRGIIPNVLGRVVDTDGRLVPRLYVTGWAKRGANGIIGTNRADSLETTNCILSDLSVLPKASCNDSTSPVNLDSLFKIKEIDYVNFTRWSRIDAMEVQRGLALGKPRDKFIRCDEMLAV